MSRMTLAAPKPSLAGRVLIALAALALVATALVSTAPPAKANGGYPWADATTLNASTYDWGYATCPSSAPGCKAQTYPKNGILYGQYDPWNYYFRNCTSYIAWKLSSLGVPANKFQGLGNGKDWVNAASRGIVVNTTPAPGSVAIQLATTSNPYGHVAYVESVNGSSITVSEYNYGTAGNYGTRTVAASSFQRYAHYEALTGAPGGGTGQFIDGTYIAVPNGSVYLVAGGAPFPVTSWEAVGGPKSVTHVTQQQFDALRRYPVDGTYVVDYGSPSVYMVAGGAYFPVNSWAAVGGQKTVVMLPASSVGTHLRRYPLDGTYVVDYGSPSVYMTAGGAPFPVTSWEAVGGPKSVVTLPASSVGTRLRQYPANGTYVVDYGSPSVYVVAGGMGLRVTSWAAVGGVKGVTTLPASSVGNVLRSYPLDGTYLRNYSTGGVYLVNNGSTSHLYDWGPEGPQPYTDVDQWALVNQLNATE